MTSVIAFAKNLKEHPDLSGYGFKYAWLEGVREARLCFLDRASNWHDPTLWPAGRLFGETGEYRWQALPGGLLHAVIFLEDGPLPEGFEGRLDLHRGIEPDSPLILWGEWVDPAKNRLANPDGGPRFHAREIPKIQDYPLSEEDLKLIQADAANEPRKVSPCLVVRRYQHPAQGEFLRCVGLTAADRTKERRGANDEQDQSL